MYGLNAGFGFNFNKKFNIKIFGIISDDKYVLDYKIYDLERNETLVDRSLSDKRLGFGAGLSLGYFVAKRVEVLLGYKFSRAEVILSGTNSKGVVVSETILTNSANLGLAYNF